MRRALAVLGALAMVVLAVVVRGAIDDDSAASGGGDGEAVVLCARDLAVACEALDGVEVRLADAAETAGLVEGGDLPPDVDAWVTSGAWVEVLASRKPGALGAPTLLARSPVVVASDPDRTVALTRLCAAARLWRCLGDHAGEPWSALGGEAGWGDLKTGLPDPFSTTGLTVLAAAAAGFFGDADFATNDFVANDLSGWLSRVAASGPDRDPIGTLVTQKGRYTAAGGLAARLAQVTRPADRLDPAPGVSATVVIVAVPGGDRVRGVDSAREALAEAGWSADDGEWSPILKPGVLSALLTTWTEEIS